MYYKYAFQTNCPDLVSFQLRDLCFSFSMIQFGIYRDYLQKSSTYFCEREKDIFWIWGKVNAGIVCQCSQLSEATDSQSGKTVMPRKKIHRKKSMWQGKSGDCSACFTVLIDCFTCKISCNPKSCAHVCHTFTHPKPSLCQRPTTTG